MVEQKNLFGETVDDVVRDILRSRYVEPPFSILDSRQQNWQDRKRTWKALGIESEVGRDATVYNTKEWVDKLRDNGTLTGNKLPSNTSIFDPALCEVLYRWFVPDGGKILDPFAGGSVRGVVAEFMGYHYTGIDIREEQVMSNYEQANKIFRDKEERPFWIIGDANVQLDYVNDSFDFVFSCPPYGDLEVYSDLDGDISNMEYDDFLVAYRSIIAKSCKLLKSGGYACFVVGGFRDKKGNYRGFVPDTVRAFTDCGMKYYNEGVLINSFASAAIRDDGNMKNKKLVKVHQNILVFKKD